MRGALKRGINGAHGAGIIPACAGSTKLTFSKPCAIRDHPRMCGEHSSNANKIDAPQGSSPHVRGARIHAITINPKAGIIPACAGSTSASTRWWCPGWDHPRMCGEHPDSVVLTVEAEGSSPHVRGARAVREGKGTTVGIIPACAGSTQLNIQLDVWQRDHPRMCGEHLPDTLTTSKPEGSSPHVRGAPFHCSLIHGWTGIIPACAGSTLRK